MTKLALRFAEKQKVQDSRYYCLKPLLFWTKFKNFNIYWPPDAAMKANFIAVLHNNNKCFIYY